MKLAEKSVTLDLHGLTTEEQLHKKVQLLLGFPDFYGNNINALIDCLYALRFPDQELININIGDDEVLILELLGVSGASHSVVSTILYSTEAVNQRYHQLGKHPAIALIIM